VKTFDQLVTKVEEGWWNQAKAKVAGMGSSIAGDQAGAAKKQAQSLAMSSPAFALFDQFKQDMLELTKSTDQLQFNKKFPEQAKFITNIEANLAVLKAGNVGDPAAAEQQPDVATTKGAASVAARAKRDQINKQNQDAARAVANPTDAAATAGGAAPSVQAASVHVNDVDMINEAYYGMQEAPIGKAKWAARRAKMGNLMKTVTGRGGEVVDATMAAVNSRMETFKKKFQDTLGKLQTDLTKVGLGAESPALQAITNTLGSAEQIPPTTQDDIAAATPEEEPPAEEPVPGEEPPAEPDSTTTVDVGGDDETTATFAAPGEEPSATPKEPAADPEVDTVQGKGKPLTRAQKDRKNLMKRMRRSSGMTKAQRDAHIASGGKFDGQTGAAIQNVKKKAAKPASKNIGWNKNKLANRGESFIRGTEGVNEFVSRYL